MSNTNNLAPVFLKLAQLECASDRKDEQPWVKNGKREKLTILKKVSPFLFHTEM